MTGKAEGTGSGRCSSHSPYYNKPTQEGMYSTQGHRGQHSLPCVLYNVPARTVTNLAPETVIRLSEVKNIVGVKECERQSGTDREDHPPERGRVSCLECNDSDTFPVMAMVVTASSALPLTAVGKHSRNGVWKTMKHALISGQHGSDVCLPPLSSPPDG